LFENLAVYEIRWRSIVEPNRLQMTVCCTNTTYWVPKSTNTPSEYGILTAFILQRASLIRHTYMVCLVRAGTSKSLARPNSQCRITESIVSLERGVCSCAELQVFSCYTGLKEACQATHTISTTWRRKLSSSSFLFLLLARQGAE